MKQKFDCWYLLLVIPILRICMPWFQYRIRMAIIVPFFVIWLIHMLCKPIKGNVPCWRQLRISFLWLMVTGFLYELLPLFYMRFGLPYDSRVVFNWGKLVGAVSGCVFISIVYLSFVHRRFKEFAFLLIIILGAGIYSGFMSLLHGDQIEGGAARFLVTAGSEMARGRTSAFDNAAVTAEYGLAGYSLTYTYAFCLPIVIYAAFCIKNRGMIVLCLCSAIGFAFAVAKGGLQTPVVIAYVGVGLLVVSLCTHVRKGVIFFGIGLMAALFIFSVAPKTYSFMNRPLRVAANFLDKPVYKERLISLADAVGGDVNAYAYNRYQLQVRSWNLFCENLPFGGGNKVSAGDHSEFLDTLAYFGVVGFVVYVLYFVCLTRFFSLLGRAFIGRQSLFMLYLYISMYLFASVANPVALVNSQIIIVIAALGLFFRFAPLSAEMKERQQILGGKFRHA